MKPKTASLRRSIKSVNLYNKSYGLGGGEQFTNFKNEGDDTTRNFVM